MKAAGESMSIRGAFWAICAVMRSYLAVTCLNVVFVAPKQPDVPLVTVQSTQPHRHLGHIPSANWWRPMFEKLWSLPTDELTALKRENRVTSLHSSKTSFLSCSTNSRCVVTQQREALKGWELLVSTEKMSEPVGELSASLTWRCFSSLWARLESGLMAWLLLWVVRCAISSSRFKSDQKILCSLSTLVYSKLLKSMNNNTIILHVF